MIGGTFEYLMSSLPDLSFQNTDEAKNRVLGLLKKYAGSAAERLSTAEILDSEAGKFLLASMFDIFQKMNLKNIHEPAFQKSKIEVLSAFSKCSFEMKKDLKARRIHQNGGDKKTMKDYIENIAGEGTPLEIEIQIMKYQWDRLEDFSAGHFSDMEALFAYKIKLLILLRWWSFDAAKGFASFTQLTTND